MMHISLPEAIRRAVTDQPCTINDTGLSGAQVLMYPEAVLKIRPDNPLAQREVALLRWIDGRLPAPRIIASAQEGGTDYLLMTRMQGRMLCAPEYLDHPARLCELLAEGMRLLHDFPAAACPVDRSLDTMLREAEARVCAGQCIPEGHEGFGPSENLLRYLQQNKPDETLLLTHGDCCLPNILTDGRTITGLIDLGDGGLSDPYLDYALAWQSLKRNLSGFFGGPVRAVPDQQLLFDCLGITPDKEKLAYYLLLDQLFW